MGIESIFGIGGPEFLFILVLAGIFLGPGRIAKVARWLGQTTAKLQNISKGFVGQLKTELDMADGSDDLRDMLKEMQDLRSEVNNLQNQISTTLNEATAETSDSISQLAEITNSIRPPTFDITENSVEPPQIAANGSTPNGTDLPVPPATPPSLPTPISVEDDPE